MGPLSPYLVVAFIRWGSIFSCQISFRPVPQAGTSGLGSDGALWGALLVMRKAEGVGRPGQRVQKLQKRQHSSKKPRVPCAPHGPGPVSTGAPGGSGRWEPREGGPTLKSAVVEEGGSGWIDSELLRTWPAPPVRVPGPAGGEDAGCPAEQAGSPSPCLQQGGPFHYSPSLPLWPGTS